MTKTFPLTREYVVDAELTIKTSYTYLPSFKDLVTPELNDIFNLPSVALVNPTVNAVVIPRVAPTATLLDMAAEPEYPSRLKC